jgi:hypothetical protein
MGKVHLYTRYPAEFPATMISGDKIHDKHPQIRHPDSGRHHTPNPEKAQVSPQFDGSPPVTYTAGLNIAEKACWNLCSGRYAGFGATDVLRVWHAGCLSSKEVFYGP